MINERPVPPESGVRPVGSDVDRDILGATERLRSPRSRSVGVIGTLALVFALGLGVGYQLRPHPQPPRPAPTPPPVSMPVEATGARCAMQTGTHLRLGVEVANRGPTPLTLRSVRTELPIGGLRFDPNFAQWGVCGQLVAPSASDELPLAPGATAWVSGLFEVLEACPAPYPVHFLLTYTDQHGTIVEANVFGFADLGGVAYSGCQAD